MVLSVPLCAVKRAQDHDGLLELDEVDASKAVAYSSRAAMDPAVDLRHPVPDRTRPRTRVIPRGVYAPPSTSPCVPLRTPLDMATPYLDLLA